MELSTLENKKIRNWSIALLLIVLIGALWVNTSTSAQSTLEALGSGAPGSTDAGPHPCTIGNIAVLEDRIHVFCTNPVTIGQYSIYYFAASGGSSHMLSTNRFLTLLNTAYALGKPIYVYYIEDGSANIPGCQTSDCRNISWLYIVP